ncbi:MAG TPA: hypothetical protein VFN09_07825, partial [Rhodanobacteraceae bacterium]|nr:hypothetical protein [Rhodanobacteraceae bacterium]
VTKAMPLDVAKPEFSWLGTGTVAGDTLYFIANSQRGKYDRRGELKDGETLSPLVIWRSDLRFEWDQGGVNLGLQEIPTAKNAKQSKVTPPAHP